MFAPNLPSLIYKGNGIEATTRPHSLNQVSLEQVDALRVAAVGPIAMGQLETELWAESVTGMHEAVVMEKIKNKKGEDEEGGGRGRGGGGRRGGKRRRERRRRGGGGEENV